MLLLKKKIPVEFGHPIKPVVQSSEWQLDPTFPFPLGSLALSGICTHCKNVLKWTNLWRVLVLFWYFFAFSLHSGNFSCAASFRWQDICEHMQIEQSLNFGGLFLGLRWLIVEVGVDEKQVRALPLTTRCIQHHPLGQSYFKSHSFFGSFGTSLLVLPGMLIFALCLQRPFALCVSYFPWKCTDLESLTCALLFCAHRYFLDWISLYHV